MGIEEKTLLDWGTQIGAIAQGERVRKREMEKRGMEKHQLESIIASLDSIADERSCLLLTAAFVGRQRSREQVGPDTAGVIINILSDLYKKEGNRDDARKLLGIAKWVYEAAESLPPERLKSVRTLEEFVRVLSEFHKGYSEFRPKGR
jgi:hypothetical protein